MTCIKTGAWVYLADYGSYVLGDAHQIGGCFILGHSTMPEYSLKVPRVIHFTVLSNPEWLAVNGNTFIAPMSQVTGHGYDGISHGGADVRGEYGEAGL